MKQYEYIEFFNNDIAIRKNLQTGDYQVIENIPEYKIIVWGSYNNTEQGLWDARFEARELVKYARQGLK